MTNKGVSAMGPAKTGVAGKQDGQKKDTFSIVQQTIAEVTGNEFEDITLDADFEDDLGIDTLSEFPLIITKLKKEMPDLALPTKHMMECATVAELVELIDEEREL